MAKGSGRRRACIAAAAVLAAGLLFMLALRAYTGLRVYQIASDTMEPALLEGEIIVAAERFYKKEKPKRGDVVVFRFEKNGAPRDFIKRVIGLPGEKVEIVNRRVYVNDRVLDDPWGRHRDRAARPAAESPRDNMAAIVVPRGFLFVLGDNRDDSFDSRYYGPVETAKVQGKALYVLWGKWGRVGAKIE